jgi:integrase
MTRLHKAGKTDSPDYNLHGLRHSFGVEAALAGCTDAQGAALMGHHSPSSFATYRRQADRIRLADDAAEKIAQLRERLKNEAVNEAVNRL